MSDMCIVTAQRAKKAAGALAILVFALALAACGQPDQVQATSGGDQATQAPPAFGPPTAAYNFYEPKSEADLRADTNYGFLVAKVGPGFDGAAFKKLGVKVLDRFSANGGTYYYLHKKDNVLEALERAKAVPGLLFVEPELSVHMCETALPPGAYGEPGDPRVNGEQWGVHAIKAVDAWKTHGFGPHRAVVANVDTGVRFAHEDLSGKVLHAYSWFEANGTTPLSYALLGLNTQFEPIHDPDPTDYKKLGQDFQGTDGNGHGTHTCGIMSAEGNNGVGTAGVCWGPDLISYKGLTHGGAGQLWTVYGSLWHLARWKRENNYKGTIPVNFSLGSLAASYFAIDMVEYGLQNGIMSVAATGNVGQRLSYYPAAYTGVMAVGATTGSDVRWGGSNYGRHVSVVAPGHNVSSTYNTGDGAYHSSSGTSMAAPHVTGLIGYMLTFNPDLRPDQIKTYIERNADKLGGAAGFTEECGWGRINVLKTIQAVRDDYAANRTPPSDYNTAGVEVMLSTTSNEGDIIPFRFPQGLGVFLYRCDAAGRIANYVGTAIAGESWVYWDPDIHGNDVPSGDAAYFPMLRPGHYVAKARLSAYDPSLVEGNITELLSTDVFEVMAGEAAKKIPMVIKGLKIIYIQTFPTSDLERGGTADTIIELAMPGLGPLMPVITVITSQDLTYYDAINVFPMFTKPGNYYIRVYGFHVGNWTDPGSGETYYLDCRGEYALHFTNNPTNWQPWPAPGTYTEAKGGPYEGSRSQSFYDSQPVEFDTIYYGSLEDHNWKNQGITAGGDWYSFEVK